MDKSALVRLLQQLASQTQPLGLREFCAAAGVSQASVQRLFGGWRKLREAAGLPAAPPARCNQVYSRDMLVDCLKTVARGCGPQLSVRTFCESAGVSTETIYRHFGSWRRFRTAAGLGPRDRKAAEVSTLELLFELHAVVEKLQQFPTICELNRWSIYSGETYLRRFGSTNVLALKYWDMHHRLVRAFRIARETNPNLRRK